MSGAGPLWQNSFYIGNTFNAILYGAELVFYYKTMLLLSRARAVTRSRRAITFFMFFSTASLVLITIFLSTQAIFGEEMWIVNVNYPGGRTEYFADHVAVWYQTMGTAASIILQLMGDGLLIYRCFIVWSDFRVVIIPCLLWIATLVFGILECYFTGIPDGNFFAGLAADIGVVYYALAICLNVLVTSFICGRIITQGRRMDKHFGSEISNTYFSAAALVIESALPYTLSGVAFLISFGLNSEISILFLSFYVMFTCVSPQMLILRVACGRAWNRGTGTLEGSTLGFSGPDNEGSRDGVTIRQPPTTIQLRNMGKANVSSDGSEGKFSGRPDTVAD
ncbi:hypothetical protein HYDPIDRAFT_99320 [Hydnomerulius pinastri MD-312]|uniref:Chitin synthase export chaperone n=1 Tax=Hydnomerulius pinastri MD-312 TaxID=994086 RepID=A0A0C9VQV3_9AGAM|nr:hypothetical protein HYDPIDRAFT_99320 [Hydnomerulius pinastri MD-312]